MLQNNLARSWLVILCTIFWVNQVFAATIMPTTAPQDIAVSSHAFKFDSAKGMALYEGNVFAKQGDRELSGDKLEIYRNSKGDIAKIVVYGHLAHYQGRMAQDQAMLLASAEKITYLPKTEYFILEEKAEISQNGEFYRAPRIEYDAKLQKMYSPRSSEGNTSIVLKKSQH